MPAEGATHLETDGKITTKIIKKAVLLVPDGHGIFPQSCPQWWV